jgi:hypothetical protein
MAALNPTNSPYRHIIGDLAVRFYNLTGSGTTGDTLLIPGITDILDVTVTPVTGATAFLTSWTGNTITFTVTGAWTATVAVFSRVG